MSLLIVIEFSASIHSMGDYVSIHFISPARILSLSFFWDRLIARVGRWIFQSDSNTFKSESEFLDLWAARCRK